MPGHQPGASGQLLVRIREVHPEINVNSVRSQRGQYNDVLILNNELVFRFPRSPRAAGMLKQEAAVLRAIRPFVSVQIPDPDWGNLESDEPFVGYRMIPGEPLRREAIARALNSGQLQRLGDQLARFLRELHAVPLDHLELELPLRDSVERWVTMYADVREHLFVHMRPSARDEVSRHFESMLSTPERLRFKPALRHGDFGAGNILWDPATWTITGVIDFSFAGLGDPAMDAAAISTMGDVLLDSMFVVYPDLREMLDRVRFYRGTYALMEALDGVRDRDSEAFERGLRQYR